MLRYTYLLKSKKIYTIACMSIICPNPHTLYLPVLPRHPYPYMSNNRSNHLSLSGSKSNPHTNLVHLVYALSI